VFKYFISRVVDDADDVRGSVWVLDKYADAVSSDPMKVLSSMSMHVSPINI
jgi:hypothetical protein